MGVEGKTTHAPLPLSAIGRNMQDSVFNLFSW